VNGHLPNRPSWDCQACGKDWPCDPAREYIAQQSPTSVYLSIMMWAYFEQFLLDNGPGPLSEVYERFMGWTRGRATPGA
jgi:hypothetical protein